MQSIPKSSEKQEFKVYFKDLDLDLDLDFEEGSSTVKTVLSSTVNKDINLTLDVIK